MSRFAQRQKVARYFQQQQEHEHEEGEQSRQNQDFFSDTFDHLFEAKEANEPEERKEEHELRDQVARGMSLWSGVPLVGPLFKASYGVGEEVDERTGMSDGVYDEMNEAERAVTRWTGNKTLGRIAGGAAVIPATLAAPFKAISRGLDLGGSIFDDVHAMENQRWLEQEHERIEAKSYRPARLPEETQVVPKEPVQIPKEKPALPKGSVFNRKTAFPANSVFAQPASPYAGMYE